MDILPQLTDFTQIPLVLDRQEHIGEAEVEIKSFLPQKLFPITLEQATCNYELLEHLSKSLDSFVNGFRFNESCPEGGKISLWAWDTFTKTKELLEFYDCVAEQLETGCFEGVEHGKV